jgi:serine/threonine protein kinase
MFLLIVALARLSTRSMASRPLEVHALAPNSLGQFVRVDGHQHDGEDLDDQLLDEDLRVENGEELSEAEIDPDDNTGDFEDFNLKSVGNESYVPDVSEEGSVIGYRWNKGRKLGKGSFGEVWEATASGNELRHPVVLKMEKPSAKKHELDREAAVLRRLQGGTGIPKFHQYMDNEGMPLRHRFLAMQKLGINLEKYRTECGGTLGEAIVLRLATQMIDRFKHVHDNKYVYRDTKPENFMLGWDHENQKYTDLVHLIDFGLTGTYYDPTWKSHLPQRGPDGQLTNFVGTQRYASMDGLRRLQQSRRDDMETLAYVWGHLYTGALPWAGMSTKEFEGSAKEKKAQMLKKQVQLRHAAKDNDWRYLTDKARPPNIVKRQGDEIFPPVIKDYLKRVLHLKYDERPDYDVYQHMINRYAQQRGIDLDAGFLQKDTGRDTYSLRCE